MPFTSAADDDAITLRTGCCFRVVPSPPPPPPPNPVLFLPLVVLIEETLFWVDDKALPATDDDDIIINVPPMDGWMDVKGRTKVPTLSKGRRVERKAYYCTNIKPSSTKAFCRPVLRGGTRRSGWFSAASSRDDEEYKTTHAR